MKVRRSPLHSSACRRRNVLTTIVVTASRRSLSASHAKNSKRCEVDVTEVAQRKPPFQFTLPGFMGVRTYETKLSTEERKRKSQIKVLESMHRVHTMSLEEGLVYL